MKTKKTNRNNKSCQHIQLSGTGEFDGNKFFTFNPDIPVNGVVGGFRKRGHAQQLTNGTFCFVADEKSHASQALTIKKLLHGRVSLTKQGYFQLTLRFHLPEPGSFSVAMVNEAADAAEAICRYLHDN